MLNRHLAIALLGTTLVAAPALAQSNNSSANTPSTARSNQAETPLKPGQWRASQLRGLNVYNNNNEKIGDINELIVDRDGKIDSVVVGAGGFLGMGEHDVAVPFSQIKWVDEPRANTTTSANNNTNNANRNTATGEPASTATSRPANAPVANGATARNERAYPDHAVLNMSKDQLKALPEVRYSR